MKKGVLLVVLLSVIMAMIVIFFFTKDPIPVQTSRHVKSVELNGNICEVTVNNPQKSIESTQTERFESPSCVDLKEGDAITYQYLNRGKHLYIVSINNELTRDPLSGVITNKFEEDENFYISVESPEIGKESFLIDKSDWRKVNLSSEITFYLDIWGRPIQII
ncbi:hypothetical protein ASD24_22420 [Paenibacillus sp. Root52]|uniref:hypothetical protein n=1 Tax=Paenibacillus sp. Root52 TaxID=1736552 RepID=UPI0006FB0794|nr:hypothetical protein [Paenibacillus sp. Root52]KQY92065.1 hypothetical protein ASD24_22420 [Paenibacillus sp. Root52]